MFEGVCVRMCVYVCVCEGVCVSKKHKAIIRVG